MFPIGDDDSGRTITPIVTWVLIAINVAVFLYEISLGEMAQQFINTWGAVPSRITRGSDYATLITSMFLHGGWMHLIGNMLYLKVFGDNVEDRMGHARFLLFYFITGIVAGLAQILLNAHSSVPSVGASGAIAGVLGAYMVLCGRNRVRTFVGIAIITVPAWAMIGFWALQQVLSTYASIAIARTEETGGVAYAAHVGGFLAGLLLGPILGRRQRSITERVTAPLTSSRRTTLW